MSRIAIYRLDALKKLQEHLDLKHIVLFFDKIYIDEPTYKFNEVDKITYKLSETTWSAYKEQDQLFKYLIDEEIIHIQKFKLTSDINSLSDAEKEIFEETKTKILGLDGYRKQLSKTLSREELYSIKEQMNLNHDTLRDLFTRIAAIEASKILDDEVYPILHSIESFEIQGRKTKIVKFILNNLPQPDIDVPWQQIIEFRNEQNTRFKYLALINWINEIASTSLTMSEIKDKYEYLYLEYKRSFEKFKIKFSLGTVEVLASAAVGFFSSNLPLALNAVSSTLKFSTSVFNLFIEEEKINGKEIGYIFHANKHFPK